MYFNLLELIIKFVDYQNKKKVINFFKKHLQNEIINFIDVGAHHGETIKTFKKNFNVKNFFAFEPSIQNFKNLEKKIKNINNFKIFNIGLGENKTEKEFTQHFESQSSTLLKINKNSNYYKRKNFYLDFFGFKKNEFFVTKIKIDRLDNILKTLEINKVDILKIDTEGYDFHVIKGLGEFIKNINYIYFEHHFHNMLIKDYNLSNIHELLVKNNFKKSFKVKMNFRKTFEYIYTNKNLKNN